MTRSFLRTVVVLLVVLLVLVAFVSTLMMSTPTPSCVNFAPTTDSSGNAVSGATAGGLGGILKHSPPGTVSVSASSPFKLQHNDVLLVDGRERCEHLIPFINDILSDRTFGGHIVILVYWPDEMDVCKKIFQPVLATRLTVFFAGGSGLTPYLYEQSLTIYYGALAFIEANPQLLSQKVRIAALRPDEVNWCRSPMDSIPQSSGEDDFVYITHVHKEGFAYDNPEFPQNLWQPQEQRFIKLPNPSDAIPIDHFFGGSPRAVAKFARNVLAISKGTFAKLSYHHFDNASLSEMIKPFAETGGAYSPAFVHANCHFFLKPSEENAEGARDQAMPSFEGNPLCLPEHKIVIGTRLCRRYAGDKKPSAVGASAVASSSSSSSSGSGKAIPLTPLQIAAAATGTTPMCRHAYRWAVNEVPSYTSLAGAATTDLVQGTALVRKRKLFAKQPKAQPQSQAAGEGTREYPDYYADQTARCPKGKLGIMTMMAGYTVTRVEMLLASFLAYADPHCVTLISFVHPEKGFEAISDKFPGRFEFVFMDANSSYMRNRRLLQSCTPVDGRFEPISLWTDENWHRFRYMFQIDSRDLVMLADPYAALMTVLFPTKAESEKYPSLPRHGTYDPSTLEFMGDVAEDFTIGGSSWPHRAVSFCANIWTSIPCGEKCYHQIAKSSFTNGEPFAVVNTGNMIGTGLGMRDYLRTHLAIFEDGKMGCFPDQGHFTIIIYGLIQLTGFPHRILVLSSSYSGFANGMHSHHSTKEHTLNTCDGRPVAFLHQGDRWGVEWGYILKNPTIGAMLPKIRDAKK